MTTEQNIKTNVLGKSGIEVTQIGIGLWAAGGDEWGATQDDRILSAIDFALEGGVNFYDTADVYGMGHSEELLGKAMQGRRDQFIVATKIGWIGFDEEADRTAYTTVDKLIEGVESNLRRLQTDYVDLMQSHIDHREPTMEVFLEGFQRLQQQGKIRAYGVSTSDFEYLQVFNQDDQCSTLQIDYSILNRTAEAEILPYCEAHNIGVLVRGALAMGILADKFTPETRFEEGDFRRRWHENPEEYETFLQDLKKVEELRPLVDDTRSMAQLAFQFPLSHPAVSSILAGVKNVQQARENIEAARLPLLTKQEHAHINKITPPAGGRKIWPA